MFPYHVFHLAMYTTGTVHRCRNSCFRESSSISMSEPFEFPDGIKQVPRSFIPCPIFPGFVAVAYRVFAFNGNIYRRDVSQMG